MNLETQKKLVAEQALQFVPEQCILGIGTGSTVNCFIDLLPTIKTRIMATVASSKITATKLINLKLPVISFNEVSELVLYIDGADSCNNLGQLIKGGGGALTSEKILAYNAKEFICIADSSKLVGCLGDFPVAIEVLPEARSSVARQIVKYGGQPVYRSDFVTDHGNIILDTYGWNIKEPISLEKKINNIPGVVENGIFASRTANKIITTSNNNEVNIIVF